MVRPLLLALALLATSALAQEGSEGSGDGDGFMVPEEPPARLRGVGRFSLQAGWRLTSNETFYRNYHDRHPELERAPASPGGPLLVGSFAYSFTDVVELGVDLVATGERLRLTGQPTLTTVSVGALVGMRFQKLLPDVGRHGLVPFAGVAVGPTFVVSQFDGLRKSQEYLPTALVGSVGATLRLSPRWGLTAEYRLAFVRGQTGFVRQPNLELESFGSFNAGGNWLSVGFNYAWPPKPSRGAEGFSGF